MVLREQNLARLADRVFDVLVIGGGINGAVSAAALAARGAGVALIDARDFAGFTSQQSSNLVWGGIKYMEYYDFPLVTSLCKSRNELMRSFPSSVQEIRFLTNVSRGFRLPPLMLWAGAWLYWLMGRGYTDTPTLLSASDIAQREPAINTENSQGGFEYSDAYLQDNDARFVFDFVRSAVKSGCATVNYIECCGGQRGKDGLWQMQARDCIGSDNFAIRARVVINACGAFVDEQNRNSGVSTKYKHVLSKGIHLIVPRIGKGRRVLAFFADDGRLFFAIPMGHRTCIGTTDNQVAAPHTQVTPEDREFVLSNINARLNLKRPLTEQDVIAERCGVRPLAMPRDAEAPSDFLQLSRKHVVEVDKAQSHISLFGGKLTDCLNLGDEVCTEVGYLGVELAGASRRWYGEPDSKERDHYLQRAQRLGLDEPLTGSAGESIACRLWRRYGTDAVDLLDRIEADRSLAEPAIEGAAIRLVEISYMEQNEMIVKLEDFLRRRSKLELVESRERLESSAGLRDVCRILFGTAADAKWQEYFSGGH